MFARLMIFTGILSLMGLIYLVANDPPVTEPAPLLAERMVPPEDLVSVFTDENYQQVSQSQAPADASPTPQDYAFTLPADDPADTQFASRDSAARLPDAAMPGERDIAQLAVDAENVANPPDAGAAHQISRDAKAEVQARLRAGKTGQPSISTPPERPVIDFARMGEDQRLVLIGRAPAHSEIAVWIEDQQIAGTTSDQQGQWSAFPSEPIDGAVATVSVTAGLEVDTQRRQSEHNVMISQEARDGEPLIVLISRADERFGRVLQGGTILEQSSGLKFDHINYDREGRLQLRGRGEASGRLSIEDDLGVIETVRLEEGMPWSVILQDRPRPGLGLLRLVHRSEDGRTLSEIQMPIERIPADALPLQAPDDFLVIQPGSALWNVGRKLFDDGNRYLYMPEADDDPDRPVLLFPGHVLFAAEALPQ